MSSKAPSTAVATRDSATRDVPALSPEREAKIAEAKARSAVAKAIRGTIWGRDCHPTVVDAVVAYCRQNGLDAVRHVEVLGGNIYLTATFYDERGAPLLYSGEVSFEEPDYINADARLDDLGKTGDSWAIDEALRRKRERIRWNVPEAAKAAVVQRAKLRSGMVAVGVNWCGQPGGKKDPVGESEPSKTAQTRARRRCWRQIADFVPSYAQSVRPIEENAKGALPIAVVEAPSDKRQIGAGMVDTGRDENYAGADATASDDAELLREDQELAAAEGSGRKREPGEEA